MNAKQLIRAAALLHERDKSARGMFQESGLEAAKGFDGHLADHILATVREDDDELIDEEWAGCVSNNGPLYVDKRHYIWPTMAGFVLCSQMDEQSLPHIKTRGDFRTLCRLLGVTLSEAKGQA